MITRYMLHTPFYLFFLVNFITLLLSFTLLMCFMIYKIKIIILIQVAGITKVVEWKHVIYTFKEEFYH